MTFEKRCSVEASDVLALSFECASCGAAFRVPSAKLDREGIASLARGNCAYCGKPSGFDGADLAVNNLVSLCKALKSLGETASEKNLKIKFELKCADLEQKS